MKPQTAQEVKGRLIKNQLSYEYTAVNFLKFTSTFVACHLKQQTLCS